MKDVIIRKASRQDIPGVFSLVVELATYEKARHEVTMTVDDYQELYAEGFYQSIVALIDDEVVGTCVYYDTFSTWKGRMLYLEDFVVKENKRGLGIGQKLYDYLIEYAREKKYALVKWQVLDWNEPAINFYKRNNAIIDKEWWNCKVIF